ncbi:hypothetical protein DVH24_042606 [Malus domestica]|uniref:Jasmonate O-methyltransferase n=1 Tax=Malus domestica TaxID=3750 RepID=A0A498KNY3_MALDO|nr:hypothetical protein DVH24_042606 [Malus domestica]
MRFEAYSLQFHKDFLLFLKSRAEEIVRWRDECVLTHRQGLVEEEKVDSFNAPYYAPSEEELKFELGKEGSFTIDRLEAFEIDWDGGAEISAVASGQRVAKTVRAVVESMIESHFGKDIMDDLFRRYSELVADHLSKSRTKHINLVVSVIRND